MCLRGFTAAQFYSTALAGEYLEETLGRPLIEVEALYSRLNANTASAIILRDNLPTLPADEACAIIYAAIQVNFPDNMVNEPITFPAAAWSNCRDLWHQEWDEYVTPAMAIDANIAIQSQAELEKHRADPAYTVLQMDAAVLPAVKAVYRFKNAIHDAFKAALAANPDDEKCGL